MYQPFLLPLDILLMEMVMMAAAVVMVMMLMTAPCSVLVD